MIAYSVSSMSDTECAACGFKHKNGASHGGARRLASHGSLGGEESRLHRECVAGRCALPLVLTAFTIA